MMTIEQFITNATTQLRDAGIETARLDCLILLEDTLAQDRAHLLAHPERELPRTHITNLHKKITQRSYHIPLAYIRGSSMFYGRSFYITPAVLVPRPETETMIDMLKKRRLPAGSRVVDIGSGSGCIGITAALELPQVWVGLYDIDRAALAVAGRNAQQLGIRLPITQSDLLQAITEPLAVVLANLPYVPQTYPINKATAYEPPIALFGGQDGLDSYRRLWREIYERPEPPDCVLTESLTEQHDAMTALARSAGYALTDTEGLIQQFQPI